MTNTCTDDTRTKGMIIRRRLCLCTTRTVRWPNASPTAPAARQKEHIL